MSNLVNAAEVNGRIGAGSLILNDYKLKISDIEGGHRLSVERGADVQTMDVMDGEGCKETDVTRILEETGLMKLTKTDMAWSQSNVTTYDSEYSIFDKITYANGIWLASGLGDKNTLGLWYSTDGMTWTRSDFAGDEINAITYGNGLWVVAGMGFIYSSDGITWKKSNITWGTWYAITYADGIWVASVKIDIDSGIGLAYSTDGMTWEQCNVTSGQSRQSRVQETLYCHFDTITYANGIWIASSSIEDTVGGIWYSSDGITWARSNVANLYFSPIIYADGIWVASGALGTETDSGLVYSTDGMTWERSNVTSGQFPAITHADGIWVAGGSSEGSGIYYSSDGMEWTQSNITTFLGPSQSMAFLNTRPQLIAYANGIWVAVGDTIYYSTDGMTWEETNIVDDSHVLFNNITYGNGVWVASGILDFDPSSGIVVYPRIYYSVDGMTWTETNVSTEGVFLSITYANGIWVAGGYNVGFWYGYSASILDNIALKSGIAPQVYSKAEQRIGTWINGKPIYRKTLVYINNGMQRSGDSDPTPSNGWVNLGRNGELEMLNIEQYTNVYGICETYKTDASVGRMMDAEHVWQMIPRVVPDGMAEYAIGLGDLTPTGIKVLFGSAYTYADIYLTIEYTKTTD